MRIPAELVIIENRITLQPCALYKGHLCAVINAHHICPKSWFEQAGVLVETPMINLCPTCHFNVHAMIDARIKGQNADILPPRCRALAEQAFLIARGHGLTPRLTL
jgi:hypothetical protein